MMANIVEIIMRANDQTGNVFTKINTSFKQMTGVSLSAAGGIMLVGKAIGDGIRYVNEAVDKNEKYVTSIMDMARFTGDQVDAMSRLVQVSDDVFLSQEQLNQAISIGAKKGLDMSVKGIKDLADQYNALQTPQERSILLNENFGRSGLAMGKLLELGGQGIEKAMGEIEKGLVVTEEIIKKNIAYKQSIDAVSDAQDSMAYTIANAAVPGLTSINNNWAAFLTNLGKSELVVNGVVWALDVLAGAIDAANKLINFEQIYTGMVDESTDAMLRQGVAYEEYAKRLAGAALEAGKMTERERTYYKQILSGEYSDPKWMQEVNTRLDIMSEKEYQAGIEAIGLKDALESQLQSGMVWDTNINQWVVDIAKLGDQSTLTAEEIEAAAKMESAARSEMYTTVTSLAQGLTDSEKELKEAEQDLAEYIKSNPWDNKGISDRRDAVNKLKQEQSEMVDQWLLDVYTQMITADGDLSEADMAFLLQYQVTTGMITQENADRAQSYYDQAQRILESNGLIQGSIDSIHGKDVFVNVYSNTVSGHSQFVIPKPGEAKGEEMANGGSFTVPNWAGYEGFNMGGVATASAGEKVTVSKQDTNKELLGEVRKLNSLFSTLPVLMVGALQRANQ